MTARFAPSVKPTEPHFVDGGLAQSLTQIAADPDRIGSLYEVFGPFCHEGRNLLNTLKMSLYLARKEDEGRGAVDWTDLERCYRSLERLFDRVQAICRPPALTLVRLPLSLLMEDRRSAWVGEFASTGRTLELVDLGHSEVGDYDPGNLGQALDAFFRWRAAVGPAGATARLGWRVRSGRFEVEYDESTGIPDAADGARRTKERSEALALPLLGRVIAAHGGELALSDPAGGHVRLTWPQAGPGSR
jgi:hypothetical protein